MRSALPSNDASTASKRLSSAQHQAAPGSPPRRASAQKQVARSAALQRGKVRAARRASAARGSARTGAWSVASAHRQCASASGGTVGAAEAWWEGGVRCERRTGARRGATARTFLLFVLAARRSTVLPARQRLGRRAQHARVRTLAQRGEGQQAALQRTRVRALQRRRSAPSPVVRGQPVHPGAAPGAQPPLGRSMRQAGQSPQAIGRVWQRQ